MEAVPLTSLARAGGCAAKYSAARLETLLGGLVPAEAEDLLVGLDPADDAVYRLDDERALVFTVDFFPPLVDDPRTFGAIAATNALNDVFAMGGVPLLALSIAAFPEELPVEVLGDVLAGADERVRAAGAILAGGHTIRDTEPKYGLAVVGTVHPGAIWPKAGAAPGDSLFLTKPLGTGIVLQAERDGIAPSGALDAAIASMLDLNRAAADALRPFTPNAVTDVTGFALGHVHELASRSGVLATVEAGTFRCSPPRSCLRSRESAPVATAAIATTQARTLRVRSTPHSRRLRTTRRPRAACSSPFRASRSGARGDIRRGGPRDHAHRVGRNRRGSRARVVVTAVARARTLSPGGFLRLSLASCAALFLVITSGAFVRLTGSGLGCDNWPQCGDKPYPEQGFHAFVEFGNRIVALVGLALTLVTWLGARRVVGLPRGVRLAALAAFLLTVAQIPMGAVTIALDLHPLAVTHFLLALAVLALTVVVALEAWSHDSGLAAAAGPSWLRRFVTWVGLPTCAALVVTGAITTASGPHPGADEDVKRLGLEIVDTVYVHVRVATAFGLGVLFIGWFLVRMRDRYPDCWRLGARSWQFS